MWKNNTREMFLDIIFQKIPKLHDDYLTDESGNFSQTPEIIPQTPTLDIKNETNCFAITAKENTYW